MSKPPIWDDAFELLDQFNAKEPESGNKEIAAKEPESGEKEISFREIIEEASPEQQADSPDKPDKKEVSLKSAGIPVKPGEKAAPVKSADAPVKLNEKEVSLISADLNKLNEKEVSLKNAGASMDLKNGINGRSAKDLYYEARKHLSKTFHLIKDNKDFPIDSMFLCAADIVSHIKVEANTWMQLLYKIEKDTNPDAVMHIAKHSLDTAVIATRVGIGLKLSDDRLEDLAVQTCLHDVGMLRLPPDLILKQGKLPDMEKALIKKHPEFGQEILSKFKGKYESLANIVFHEHERYDGSGYPRGIKGDDIPENSMIIGIADMYAALLHPRPYRPRRLPFEAIKIIIASSKDQFPQRIVKTLVNEFSAFPEGLYVKLNSNEVGKVTTVNRLAPLSPVVEIIYNTEGKLSAPKTVDLMKDHCLYITSGFYGEED